MSELIADNLIVLSLLESIFKDQVWNRDYLDKFIDRYRRRSAETEALIDHFPVNRARLDADAAEAQARPADEDKKLTGDHIRTALCLADADICRGYPKDEKLPWNNEWNIEFDRFRFRITGERIHEGLDLSDVIFHGAMEFLGCEIVSFCRLDHGHFGDVFFSGTKIVEKKERTNENEESDINYFNAFSGTFEGNLRLINFEAELVVVGNARVSNLFLISQSKIELPEAKAQNIGIDSAILAFGLRARDCVFRKVDTCGGIDISGAIFSAVNVFGCRIDTHNARDGYEKFKQSPYRALYAENITVDLSFSVLPLYRKPNKKKKNEFGKEVTKIRGQINLKGAKIGSDVRIASSVLDAVKRDYKTDANAHFLIDESEHDSAIIMRGAAIGGSLYFGVDDANFSAGDGNQFDPEAVTPGDPNASHGKPPSDQQSGRDTSQIDSEPTGSDKTSLSTIDDNHYEKALDAFRKWQPDTHCTFGEEKRPDGPLFVRGVIDLREMKVGGNVDFRMAFITACNGLLESAIDLRNARIDNTLSFRELHPDCVGTVDLRDATADIYRDDFSYSNDQRIFSKFHGCLKNVTNSRWAQFGAMVAMIFGLIIFVPGVSLSSAAGYFTIIVASKIWIWAALFVLSLFAPVFIRLIYRWGFRKKAGRKAGKKLSYIPVKRKRARTLWPVHLLFILPGFRYGSFVLREKRVQQGSTESDKLDMQVKNGARLRWLKHQPDLWLHAQFQPQPFVQCARVLREMGYDRQSHKVMLQRERHALGSISVGLLEKSTRWVLLILCGQGHAMHRLAVFAVIGALIGIGINDLAGSANLVRPTNAEVLVDAAYQEGGRVPVDYSAFRPVPFAFGRLLPLPPMNGRGEWAACNAQQIEAAMAVARGAAPHGAPSGDSGGQSGRQSGNDLGGYSGACLPRSCSIADPAYRAGQPCAPLKIMDWVPAGTARAAACERAKSTQAEADIWQFCRPVFDVVANAPIASGVPASLASLAPWLEAASERGVRRLNAFISAGYASRVNVGLALLGYLITILLATYATGTLKRKE